MLYNVYIPSSIFMSCFIGHVNMLLHASRGGGQAFINDSTCPIHAAGGGEHAREKHKKRRNLQKERLSWTNPVVMDKPFVIDIPFLMDTPCLMEKPF